MKQVVDGDKLDVLIEHYRNGHGGKFCFNLMDFNPVPLTDVLKERDDIIAKCKAPLKAWLENNKYCWGQDVDDYHPTAIQLQALLKSIEALK